MNYSDENERLASTLWTKAESISSWRRFRLRLCSLHTVLPLQKPKNRQYQTESSRLVLIQLWLRQDPDFFPPSLLFEEWRVENRRCCWGSLSGPPAASRLNLAAVSRSPCLGRSSGALWPWGRPPAGRDAGGSSGRPGRWRPTCSPRRHSGQKPELLRTND